MWQTVKEVHILASALKVNIPHHIFLLPDMICCAGRWLFHKVQKRIM